MSNLTNELNLLMSNSFIRETEKEQESKFSTIKDDSNQNTINQIDNNLKNLQSKIYYLLLLKLFQYNLFDYMLNFEQAIIICKKLLFFAPEDIEVYQTLADLYLKIYDISSSITCLKKILIIGKKNSKEIYNRKGNIENVFNVIKRKFSGINKSKTTRLRNKETRLKTLVYNIYRLIIISK